MSIKNIEIEETLSLIFSKKNQRKGYECYENNCVLFLETLYDDGSKIIISARVSNQAFDLYSVNVTVSKDDDHFSITSYCSCPASFNCQHGYASLLEFMSTNYTWNKSVKTQTLSKDTIAVLDKLEPTPVLHLYMNKQQVIARIEFDYEGNTVPFSLKNITKEMTVIRDNQSFILKRSVDMEQHALNYLNHFFQMTVIESSTQSGDKVLLQNLNTEAALLQLITQTFSKLSENGWIIKTHDDAFLPPYAEDDLNWYSQLEQSSEHDFFRVNLGIIIDDEKINLVPEIVRLLKNYTRTDIENLSSDRQFTFFLTHDKKLTLSFGRIKPIALMLFELYDEKLKLKDALEMSVSQASLLLEIQRAIGQDRLRWFGDHKLLQLKQRLSNFKTIIPAIPPNIFKAKLRSYQQQGLNWLQFLREHGLNGILADDMGLGKTVQIIAHLSIEKIYYRLTIPTLIVAPTSLMSNWQQEILKFCPELSTVVYHGDRRHSLKDTLFKHNIVLTTYALLVREKVLWLSQDFYYLILDEAQYIKNPRAKTTLTARSIQSKHKLCLTGTPIENRLSELWSLFNFLMPGLLGHQTTFKKRFQTPIENKTAESAQDILSSRIKPFVLRRKKTEVLSELPEKIEIIKTYTLDGAQRDLYEGVRLSMEDKVTEAIKTHGLAKSHITILAALLKLRQICCHPKLIDAKAYQKMESAKLNLLKELITTLVAEDRKILIFSQFTSMLVIIETLLKKLKISYVKLIGNTKNRQQPIEQFQSGEVSVFLISLKAGGTGLNLTKADTVIHYDPWWNPAVEDQATDRAHRLGQKSSVFVYKLIGLGTVEEAIQKMQARKRLLMDSLFADEGQAVSAFSLKDIQSFFKSHGL